MKKTYRILCLVLSFIMVASMLPFSAFADSGALIDLTYNTASENWEFYSDKNCTNSISSKYVPIDANERTTFYMRINPKSNRYTPQEVQVYLSSDFLGNYWYTECDFYTDNPQPDERGVYEISLSYYGDLNEKYLQIASVTDSKRTTTLGAKDSRSLSGQNIYFGLRDNDGDSVNEVLKWNVLGDSTYGNGILLLSDTVLENGPFDAKVGELYSNVWTGSDAESWCSGLITEAFTKKEQTLLIETLLDMGSYTTSEIPGLQTSYTSVFVEGDTKEKIFLLSAKEVEKYLPTPEDRTGYYWWLRSPYEYYSEYSKEYIDHNLMVYNSGMIDTSVSSYNGNYYRPAMNLDLSSVIMMNAASDNPNPDFSAVGAYSGNDWFLTIGDSKEFMATGYTGETTFTEGYAESDITVNHYALSNPLYHATSESIYNRVTATLTDASGNVLYYGKINSNTNAENSKVTIPEGLQAGNYTLSIRGETWGDKANMTRVATGTPYNIPITVKGADGYKVTPNEPAVQLGISALTGYTKDYGYDYITLGNDKLTWRVLDTKANTGGDGVFILSEDILANNVAFNSSATTEYSGSSADAWGSNFASTDNFSMDELFAIKDTTKSDDSYSFSYNAEEVHTNAESNALGTDKVFMLSYGEAVNDDYGLGDSVNRKAKYNGTDTAWWLRSTVDKTLFGMNFATIVEKNGGIKYGNVTASYTNNGTTTEYLGYRPAMNIDPSKVLFTVAADGSGEAVFGKIPQVSTNKWKLAVKTGDSFDGIPTKTTITKGETVTVNHSELPMGYDNVTALLLKGESPVCYGKLSPISETQSTLKIPADLEAGDYKLRIYAEDWNDGGTNYITDVVTTRNITVAEHRHSWSEEYSFDDTHHWNECTAEGCDITENSKKNSYHTHASTGVNVATFITKAVCDVCGNEYGDLKPYLGYTFKDNIDGTLTLTGYIGEETELNIPSNVLGKPVTIIGQSALEGNENITKIILPDSIKRIEKWAFKKLSNLTEITLNDGLEYIGEGAIELTAIKSITIPDTVAEIGVWAFADDEQLAEINLGTGLEKIGYVAFRNTPASQIILPASVTDIGYDVFKGYTADDTIYVHSNPALGDNAFGEATVVYCTDNLTVEYDETHHWIYCERCNVAVSNEEEHKLVEGDCTGCDFYVHITTTAPEETTVAPTEPITVTTEPTESTTPVTGEDITVYFTNNLGWENVEIGLGNNSPVAMTMVETNSFGEDVYSYTFNTTDVNSLSFRGVEDSNYRYTVVIDDFQNNSGYYCLLEYTNPYDIPVGTYTYGKDSTTGPTTVVETTTQVVYEDITVYFTNNLGWENVGINFCTDTTVPMTKVETSSFGQDVYSYTFNTEGVYALYFVGSEDGSYCFTYYIDDFQNNSGYYCLTEYTDPQDIPVGTYTYGTDSTTGPTYAPSTATTQTTEPTEVSTALDTTAPTAPTEPSSSAVVTDPGETTEPTVPGTSETTVPITPVVIGILGDADGNGKVNIKDATLIQKHVANLTEITGNYLLLSDVDNNGKVNVRDATAIQKFIANIDTGYAIGKPYIQA